MKRKKHYYRITDSWNQPWSRPLPFDDDAYLDEYMRMNDINPLQMLGKGIRKAGRAIGGTGAGVRGQIGRKMLKAGSAVGRAGVKAGGALSKAGSAIGGAAKKAGSAIGGAAKKVGGAIKGAFSKPTVGQRVGQFAKNTANRVGNFVKNNPGKSMALAAGAAGAAGIAAGRASKDSMYPFVRNNYSRVTDYWCQPWVNDSLFLDDEVQPHPQKKGMSTAKKIALGVAGAGAAVGGALLGRKLLKNRSAKKAAQAGVKSQSSAKPSTAGTTSSFEKIGPWSKNYGENKFKINGDFAESRNHSQMFNKAMGNKNTRIVFE